MTMTMTNRLARFLIGSPDCPVCPMCPFLTSCAIRDLCPSPEPDTCTRRDQADHPARAHAHC